MARTNFSFDVTDANTRRRFEGLVLPCLDAAYNLARWLVRDDINAQDIVQDAFLRAYHSFDSFRGDQARPWILAIVRNVCYTWLRENRGLAQDVPFDEEFHGVDDSIPAEAILARAQDRRCIDQALDRLPTEFREVLVLRELEDMSYKEIALVAAIPIGTVMSRLARARKLMLMHLRDMGMGAHHGM